MYEDLRQHIITEIIQKDYDINSVSNIHIRVINKYYRYTIIFKPNEDCYSCGGGIEIKEFDRMLRLKKIKKISNA